MKFENAWRNWSEADKFSGVFSVRNEQGALLEKFCGFANRGEELLNNGDTCFAIASGTKLFTGLAICKLIDAGKLSLADRLWDILKYDLGQIDKRVTLFQLLTHTSGIGDYIDEESESVMNDLQALYNRYPVYLWERLEYYLPMIAPLPMKFEPGERFGYSNAGYVLLGLVVEAVTGISYQQYVTDEITKPCGMHRTGFYRTDALPVNTAHGYMFDQNTGTWRTNIFSVPVRGGSDGGLYTCEEDLSKLWRAIFSCRLFSANMLSTFLAPQAKRGENESYGLGVYCHGCGNSAVYYAVGGDFGIDFFTAYFPGQKITASALGNTEINTYPLMKALF